jgi:hypothetical protein
MTTYTYINGNGVTATYVSGEVYVVYEFPKIGVWMKVFLN